jgi:hypothetical protein
MNPSHTNLTSVSRYRLATYTLAEFALVAVLTLKAENHSIDWSTIDGGSGTSTGGLFTVTGTIGQPDAGTMTGGNFSVTGGFWALYAVQTPGAPWLTITLNSQPSTLAVSWPVSETSWQLQATSSLLALGSTWSPCTYVTNGANCVYIESSPTGNRFYRLHKP